MKIQAKHLHVVHEFPITDTLSDILPILTKVQCTILFLSSGLLGDFPQHTQNTTIPLFCPQRSKPISPTEICIQSLKLWNSVNVLKSLTAAAPVCCTDTTTIMLQFNIKWNHTRFLAGASEYNLLLPSDYSNFNTDSFDKSLPHVPCGVLQVEIKCGKKNRMYWLWHLNQCYRKDPEGILRRNYQRNKENYSVNNV